MQNDQKQYVDLYIPRKCFATNKVLDAKDHSSVQISFADVNKYIKFKVGLNRDSSAAPLTVVLSGFVRSKGNADAALNRYLKEQGLLSFE